MINYKSGKKKTNIFKYFGQITTTIVVLQHTVYTVLHKDIYTDSIRVLLTARLHQCKHVDIISRDLSESWISPKTKTDKTGSWRATVVCGVQLSFYLLLYFKNRSKIPKPQCVCFTNRSQVQATSTQSRL